MTTATRREVKLSTVYSPDDQGWYTEVFDKQTGEDMHSTAIYASPYRARREAERWARKNGHWFDD